MKNQTHHSMKVKITGGCQKSTVLFFVLGLIGRGRNPVSSNSQLHRKSIGVPSILNQPQITLARFLPTLISANQELVLCFKPYHFGKFRIKSVAHEKTEQRSWKLDVTKIDRIKHSAKLVRFVTRRQVSRIGWRWDPLHPS